MRRRPAVIAGSLLAGLLAVPAVAVASDVVPATTAAGASTARTVVEFNVMAPVTEPFTGASNPIRGVPGGGLPWVIDKAKGELHSDGAVEVEVKGLVLARRAPVPPERQGTNPTPSFKVVVSCQTINAGAPAVVNVETQPAPATAAGDSTIEGSVSLPSPCLAPIVFVTSPTGAWFAATGV